jgi:predicted permease
MSWIQDVRYGVRSLRQNPAFTVAAVLALGLGVGVNTTVFTWLKSVLLEPLPGVADGARLVTLSNSRGDSGGYSTPYRDYLFYRDHARGFAGMTAYELAPVDLAAGGRPEIALAGLVTADYFTVLGVHPALGRGFRADEAAGAGAHAVAVLSNSLWRRRFGADPAIVGRSVSLNRNAYVVIGVAPAAFLGSYGGIAQDLWVPVSQQPQLAAGGDQVSAGSYPVQITARLRPGVTQAAAQAELDVLARQLAPLRPASRAGWHEVAYTLAQSQRGLTSSLVPAVEVLMAVVAIVLVIACLNVANLLLARALARRREIHIRLAVGAGRGRLLRQLLIESVLLAALGGGVGIALATVGAKALPALLPPLDVPLGLNLTLDARVLLWCAATAAATVLIFGLAPALTGARLSPAGALRDDSAAAIGGRRHAAWRTGLVIAQLGLSLATLVAAGLVGKSLVRSLDRRPGFAPDHLLVASYDLFLGGYDSRRGSDFDRRLLARVAALPGVRAVSLTDYAPLGSSGGGNMERVDVPGRVVQSADETSFVTDAVGPGYLRTMGIALVAGREFGEQDREGAPGVLIVNQAFAKRFLTGGSPLGRHCKVGGVDREVVGVMGDYKYRRLAEDPGDPELFVPFFQDYRSQMTLVVRTVGEPLAMLPAVERERVALDPGLAATGVMSGAQRLGRSLFVERMAAQLLGGLGLLAAVLAAVGLFGVMSYFVGRRPREIGIRMALGADRAQVLRMVLAQGLRLALGGIAAGILAAAAVTRFLQSILYQVSPLDPAIFALVATLLAAVALLACYLPAHRAAHLEPFAALRQE